MLQRIKARAKRYPRVYAWLQRVVSPIYHDRTHERFFAEHVAANEHRLCLNLGSGNQRLHPRLLNLDVAPHPEVDVVADAVALPFRDGVAAVVVNISLLEHVPDATRVIAEIHRVLRPGGVIFTDVPFLCGYHAAPADFRRWTYDGVLQLHAGFEPLRLVNKGGPTSALLWVAQEWLATVLSFGNARLHAAVYLVIMAATFPFKYLDAVLNRLPASRNISSCFVFVGRKPDGSA